MLHSHKRLLIIGAMGAGALAACAVPAGPEPAIRTGDATKASSPVAQQPAKSPQKKQTGSISASNPAIVLCKTSVSNAPVADANGVIDSGPLIEVDEVILALMPATNSCLSSGYGQRNGKLHRGIDYFSKNGGDALAAGDGVIIEKKTRADFGNMIVIDHGAGVYTRYAHLEKFAGGLVEGASIKRGADLGPIGSTGATSVRHLHYEVMSGTYVSGAGSFGLKTLDPFALPRAGA
ncbi:MAG: M23 family metallopeptidase [Parvularculaceae bacterium]